jgi:hypothetical protein
MKFEQNMKYVGVDLENPLNFSPEKWALLRAEK